ncbi:MAG: hypothetical protein MJB14_11855, partial [Spirochaetes bacterium]|nr:hypothetical protein [Spirochaetota bacterium]
MSNSERQLIKNIFHFQQAMIAGRITAVDLDQIHISDYSGNLILYEYTGKPEIKTGDIIQVEIVKK